jgi:hypothetical protein
MVVLGHCKDFLDQHEGWFHYCLMVQAFLSAGWYHLLFPYLNLDCSMVVLGHCKDFLDQHEQLICFRYSYCISIRKRENGNKILAP